MGGTDDAGEWLDKDKDSFANDFPTARLILCRWSRGQSDENDDVGRDLLDLRLGIFQIQSNHLLCIQLRVLCIWEGHWVFWETWITASIEHIWSGFHTWNGVKSQVLASCSVFVWRSRTHGPTPFHSLRSFQGIDAADGLAKAAVGPTKTNPFCRPVSPEKAAIRRQTPKE